MVSSYNVSTFSSSSLVSSRQKTVSSLLSQPGLPYTEDLRDRIKVHLLTLVQDFPSLLLSAGLFFENDGSSVDLVQAVGTIPISFYGSSYNIPVTIWLLESYPFTCPRVYVSPTPDMIIKQHHEHVDASGVVSVPYLNGWAYPHSNLTDLVRSLCAVFSCAPPLFSRVAARQMDATSNGGSALSGNGNNSSATCLQLSSIPVAASRLPASNPFASSPPRASAIPWPHASGSDTMVPSRKEFVDTANDPSEVFRKNAINVLSVRIKLGLAEIRKTCETNMDKLEMTQVHLKHKHNQLKLAEDRMRKDRDCLEQQVRILRNNSKAIETWLAKNSNLTRRINIDDAFEPYDGLSRQMLECSSADLAIDDLLYTLDKAVQAGLIPMDVYLKQVRSHARDQFFCRLMSNKVEAAVRQ